MCTSNIPVNFKTTVASAVPKNLIDLFSKDPYVGGKFDASLSSRKAVLILFKSIPVGFFVPKTTDGYYRLLYLYIDPVFRKRGFATSTIKHFTKNIFSKAWIAVSNIPSQKTFEKAGFFRILEEKDIRGNVVAYIYYKDE